jgi:adenylyl-sulfate kinase
MDQTHIFPIEENEETRRLREGITGQKGHVFWLTGLSGSGKSTLAAMVQNKLLHEGHLTAWLDGDTLRAGLCRNLTFSEEDRMENVRRAAEAARLLCRSGLIVFCSFVSPGAHMRKAARDIIGHTDFSMIFVDTPAHICMQRDPKGLYTKAVNQEIKDFTGVQSAYEAPGDADLRIDSGAVSPETGSQILHTFVLQVCKKP